MTVDVLTKKLWLFSSPEKKKLQTRATRVRWNRQDDQKRSLADTRYNEEILNKVRELQVPTLEGPSKIVAS